MEIPEHLDGLDVSAALDRIGGDEDLLKEIASIFLEEYPSQLAEVRGAVRERDAAAIQHAAHSIKGSLANFGAEQARQAALRLEMMGRDNDLAAAEEALADLERAVEAIKPQLAKLVSP